jgi:DNA repair ATPase RecN
MAANMPAQAENAALEQVHTALGQILAKLENHDQRFDSMDQRFDQLHFDMLRIEHEHGAKLDALFEGQDLHAERMDRLEAGQLRLETGQARLQRDVDHIRRSVGQLQTIATDHEQRLPGSSP